MAKLLPSKKSVLPPSIAKLRMEAPTIFWKGPIEQGVTQSIVGDYVTCGERCRIKKVLGLDKPEEFNKNLDYGNMWHTCEEYYYKKLDWKEALKKVTTTYCRDYPSQQEDIYKWYRACELQYEVYLKYWKKHEHEKTRKNIFTEKEFEVEYRPKGYTGEPFLLRGKWDGLDLIKNLNKLGIFFQENKTKSEIDDVQLTRSLKFDLQTMFYLVALYTSRNKIEELKKHKDIPIAGVRYNVIRRPLSGGKGSITRHKATKNKPEETLESYFGRLKEVFEENASTFFARYTVLVQPWEIKQFQEEFLDPVLLNLKDDYEWWKFCFNKDEEVYNYQLRQEQFPTHYRRHFRLPYSIWNPIAEGYRASVDDYLDSGSTVGLRRRKRVFPELSKD
mgnify:CR=1 FL=1